MMFQTISLFREFLGKNPKSSLVMSQLRLTKLKLYVQIECHTMVQISNGISQYKRKYAVLNEKYMPFFGP